MMRGQQETGQGETNMAMPSLGRLLIVDDEVELLNALCETLTEQNYEVVGRTSGREGLDALESQTFDLLLSDLMMPGMDGIELLRQALTIDPQLVGIIMTGQGTVQTAVEAMKLGAFDYVFKPFKLQMMLPVFARGMEVRRLRMAPVDRAAQLRVAALPLDWSKSSHAAGGATYRKGRPHECHGPGPRA